MACSQDKTMEYDDMGCKCGGHWEFKDGKLVCSSCPAIAPFQPVVSHKEALEKYEELLRKCQDLAEDEISLNDFKVFFANLE